MISSGFLFKIWTFGGAGAGGGGRVRKKIANDYAQEGAFFKKKDLNFHARDIIYIIKRGEVYDKVNFIIKEIEVVRIKGRGEGWGGEETGL